MDRNIVARKQDIDHFPPVAFIDGECILCSRLVFFVLKRERSPVLRFALLKSNAAETMLPTDITEDTLVFLERGRVYDRSDAVLRMAGYLKGPWRYARRLLCVPKGFRDFFYTIVARHRYQWFGRSDTCINPGIYRERFL